MQRLRITEQDSINRIHNTIKEQLIKFSCFFLYGQKYKINTIYNTKFTEEVKIGKYRYDAIGAISDRIYLVECKYIKNNITINRLRDTYQQVLRYKENLLKKNPHIIIVFVLEKYTDAVSKNIKEYYQSIAPDIDIYVFDYNELKTQFKSIE